MADVTNTDNAADSPLEDEKTEIVMTEIAGTELDEVNGGTITLGIALTIPF